MKAYREDRWQIVLLSSDLFVFLTRYCLNQAATTQPPCERHPGWSRPATAITSLRYHAIHGCHTVPMRHGLIRFSGGVPECCYLQVLIQISGDKALFPLFLFFCCLCPLCVVLLWFSWVSKVLGMQSGLYSQHVASRSVWGLRCVFVDVAMIHSNFVTTGMYCSLGFPTI